VVTNRSVRIQLRQEATLASPRWRESELAHAFRDLPNSELLFSNMPHVIYLYSERACQRAPRRHYFGAENQPADDLAQFVAATQARGEAWLAWFEIPSGRYFYEPAEYPPSIEVTPEKRFGDGVLYRLRFVAASEMDRTAAP